MKKILTLIVLLLSVIINAQNKVELTGKVTNKNKEAIEMVAVTVFNSDSNKLIKYTYTDELGDYYFTLNRSVNIYLKVDFLGYKDYKSEFIKMDKIINKAIELKDSQEILDEVEIFAKKNLIKIKGDKTIFDVASSGLGEGNTGLETISNLPGMRLDKDDNIVFRGNSNLQIMINGRKSLLTGDALNDYLKALGGDAIKNIEIVTSPSARYDASGTAGVVNIQLKKAVNIGLTGNVSGMVGGVYLKNSYGSNLYYQKGKWNLNFSGRYGKYNSINERKIIRDVFSKDTKNTIEQLNDWLPKTNAYSGKFGVEYNMNKNHTFGTSVNYNFSKDNNDTKGRTNEFINTNFIGYTLLKQKEIKHNKAVTGNVYHSYSSDSLTTKINTQFNYAFYDHLNDGNINNSFYDSSKIKNKADNIVKLNNDSKIRIYSTKLDVEQNISKSLSTEFGTKFSYVSNDYENQYQNKINNNFVVDKRISNHLLYKEQVFSGYTMLNYNTKKWGAQLGVRFENTNYEVNSLTQQQKNKNEYTSWFPSFSVNRKLEHNTFQFSYSKRIQRPNYINLSPFYSFLDTYNVEVGNPNLKPEFVDAFNFSWIYKNKTTVSLYSNFEDDIIADKLDFNPETNISTITLDNMMQSISIGLSVSSVLNVSNKWTVYPSIDGSYSKYNSKQSLYNRDFYGYYWYADVNNELKFNNNWKLYISGYYSGKGVDETFKSRAYYDMSFRVRKTFGNWSMQLRGSDLFKKAMFSGVMQQKNVRSDWTNKWETRRIVFSVQYNFGKGKKKGVKAIDLGEEKKRL